jgi:hypothetical protein
LITASVRRADTMKKLWSMPVNTNATAIIGGLAILYQPSDQPSETHLAAFTDTTGEKRWEIPSGEVCGITTTQLLLMVNDQLATIDLSNGQQLSYKDAPEGGDGQSACPTMLGSGLSLWQNDGGIDVVQELQP